MAVKNTAQLLEEQLGTSNCDVIATTAMTGKNYYAIYFPVDTVVASIVAENVTTDTGSAIANLHTSFAAGVTLFINVTAITLTSGVALCYHA